MKDFEISDVLGCLGSDLIDVARRVAEFPAELQLAAASVELSTITTKEDPLSLEIARVLAVINCALESPA